MFRGSSNFKNHRKPFKSLYSHFCCIENTESQFRKSESDNRPGAGLEASAGEPNLKKKENNQRGWTHLCFSEFNLCEYCVIFSRMNTDKTIKIKS